MVLFFVALAVGALGYISIAQQLPPPDELQKRADAMFVSSQIYARDGTLLYELMDPSGEIMYTRAGNFSINSNGQIVEGSAQTGRLLEPPIVIPQDAQGIVVSADGKVSVRQPNTPTLTQVGTIELAMFINPEGLLKQGENLYSETNSSGTVRSLQPGQQGVGTIQQNALEASNVEPVTELIDLITTQRAFELNSQVIQSGDQIMQLIVNLRRV